MKFKNYLCYDMKMNIRLTLTGVLACACFSLGAAVPGGYYDSCKGKSGAALLRELQNVIGDHTNVGYNGLWDLYETSDVDNNGKIWDMYSTKRWNPGREQCGNYSTVGDCYNREHSLPKSWFDDASPMYSDGFHIYPTDGKVNGMRSNYPYGECANGTPMESSGSVKGLGRLGTSTFPGYSGKVFEPDDQYKGDFARSYFYMAACYNSRISTWNSDMLAGNSFPVFTSWAKELLMKWHREDPVSDKERKRNEVVYARQHNRNPFIDNPDMAEHIWGSLASTGWGSSVPDPEPVITTPASGSVIDLGNVAVGTPASRSLTVRGTNIKAAATITAAGTGYSVNPSTLTAAQMNGGATVTVTLKATAPGACNGTLTIAAGDARSTVTLKATAHSGLTAGQPVDVTSSSFEATWINSTGSSTATCQLHVKAQGASAELQGYPLTVKAAEESHTVTGLEPSTTYVYWVSDASGSSNTVSVTTRGITPEIYLEPGNDLAFTSTPGTPSAPVTIFIDAYNVDGAITVTVTPPFEVSVDKSQWEPALTLGEDDGQFYLRLNSATAGVFRTSVTATATDCINDDLSAEGVVKGSDPVVESWEHDVNFGYSGAGKQGDAARWDFVDAGVFDDTREVRTGRQGVRFNSAEGGSVTMCSPMSGGMASVTFHTRLWDDEPAEVEMHYSLDGGASWTLAATAKPSGQWSACEVSPRLEGNVSLRFVKTSGGRVALDDVEIMPLQADLPAVESAMPWDARAARGAIAVENRGATPLPLAVYAIDGTTMWRGEAPSGTMMLPMPRAPYIVVSGEESRRLVVR